MHVHQLSDGLKIRCAVGDVGVDRAEHVQCGLVEAQEHAVVDLTQTQKLQNLASLGVDAIDAVRRA